MNLAQISSAKPLLLFAALLFSDAMVHGAEQVSETGKHSAAATRLHEIDTIKKLVFDSQRDGFEKHDMEAYLAPLAKDVRIVTGRSATPNQYDLTLDRRQIEARARMTFHGKPTHNAVQSYEVVRAEIKGDEAVFETVTTRTSPAGSSRTGEIFRLRKTASGWKIYLNRCWWIEATYGDRTVAFNTDYWEKADRRVVEARESGDLQLMINALAAAIRYREAYEISKKLAQRDGASAQEWTAVGQFAMLLGDETGAKHAFDKALTLDQEALVPSYFRQKHGDRPNSE